MRIFSKDKQRIFSKDKQRFPSYSQSKEENFLEEQEEQEKYSNIVVDNSYFVDNPFW